VSIKLYVEGGGDAKALKTACRRGFRLFLEKAGLEGRMPGIVACGARQNAYDRFTTALDVADGSPMLLVDAEGPVSADVDNADPWGHLHSRDGWTRPNGAGDGQCHLMVQVMESWFLADKATLTSFYGQGFQANSLPGNLQVEAVAKADVLDGLARATRNTQKGAYSKGSHSFDILASINPASVEGAAPYAKRLLDTLRGGESA